MIEHPANETPGKKKATHTKQFNRKSRLINARCCLMRGMAPQGLLAIRELKTCQEAPLFLLHEKYYDILVLKKF